jgi:hypothetical protein
MRDKNQRKLIDVPYDDGQIYGGDLFKPLGIERHLTAPMPW